MLSKYRKTTKVVMLLLVFCCAVMIFCAVGLMPVASAEKKTEQNICAYLSEKNISYSSVLVENKVLTVKLQSTGTDRCTLDDVKAIQAVFEAVHGNKEIRDVNDVHIIIRDVNGKQIYDYCVTDAATPIEGISSLVPDRKGSVDINDSKAIYNEIHSIVSEYSINAAEIIVSEVEGISGKKADIILKNQSSGMLSFVGLETLYAELEAFSLATDAIAQCTITVEDDAGNCLYYMTGNFKYGSCTAWVSPEFHDAFVEQMGPPQY